MIIIIAAVAENNVIGAQGTLPWHIPADLARFKQLTMGHPVLMGRKTWESLPAQVRPLPGRQNIVITRNSAYPLPTNVLRAASIPDACAYVPQEDIFIIGGAEIYQNALPLAHRLELTRVHASPEGDAIFPYIDPSIWKCTASEAHETYTFERYDRIR